MVKHKPTLPGYKEHVEEAQKDYSIAFQSWLDSGKQEEGPEFEYKNECKAKRDQAFTDRKLHEDKIKADKLANDYVRGGNSQCWAPVKEVIKGNNQKPSAIINGLNNPEEIGNFWRDHYKAKLHGTDKPNLNDSEAFVKLTKEPSEYVKFTTDQALEALWQLDPNKSYYDISTPKMLRLIDKQFSSWFAHMMEIFVNSPVQKQKKFLQQDNFFKTYITPVSKGHGLDVTAAGSYRPISVSHTLAVYAERLFKVHPNYQITPPKNFFGYVKGRGTDFAVKTLKELVKKIPDMDQGEIISLDARGAFESVLWDFVFPRLASKIGNTLTRSIWLM